MVDIHCHILPNVDDGSKSWDISLQMCRMAQNDGIKHIVATPHANSKYTYDREALSARLDELSRKLGPGLTFSLGCDFHLSFENISDALVHPTRYTISGTNYLLVELSDFSVPPSISQTLERLSNAGLVPIITHPERNPILQRNQGQVLEWATNGYLIQVTANALTGRWGQKAQDMAVWLLKRSAVHVIATDAHDLDSRPPILSKARDAAAKILDESRAQALVHDNSHAIVSGRPLPQSA